MKLMKLQNKLNPMHHLCNERGVALLISIFALTLSVWIAAEISYEANTEYIIASKKFDKLQAYYGAKAGTQLSLLRVSLFKKALSSLSKKTENLNDFDMIWSMPLAWPLSDYLPTDLGEIIKSSLKETEKNSFMTAKYTTQIESEDGKIDLNNLNSISETLKNFTITQIFNIFEQAKEADEPFAKKYADFDFQTVVNDMIDWIDEDSNSLNGGSESEEYETSLLPPNQPFKNLSELHMLPSMEDDLYNILKDKITLYGSKKININYINPELLKSFPWMTEDILRAFEEKQSTVPFTNIEEFVKWIEAQDPRLDISELPFTFEPSVNFKITSSALVKDTSHTIQLTTYDVTQVSLRMQKILETETKDNSTASSKKTPARKGFLTDPLDQRPAVVYWEEF